MSSFYKPISAEGRGGRGGGEFFVLFFECLFSKILETYKVNASRIKLLVKDQAIVNRNISSKVENKIIQGEVFKQA